MITNGIPRIVNLASVSPYKRDEDKNCTSGDTPTFCYFEGSQKEEYRVISTEDHIWVFNATRSIVNTGPNMYVVTPDGAFYIFNTTVHSQLTAAGPVQSAGWVQYNREDPTKTIIDNCSGHYSPTLSQFISTLIGMHQSSFLPLHFVIKLNKNTTIDIPQNGRINEFFTHLLSESAAETEITVKFRENMIVFFIDNDRTFEARIDDFSPQPLQRLPLWSVSPTRSLYNLDSDDEDAISSWSQCLSMLNSSVPRINSTQDDLEGLSVRLSAQESPQSNRYLRLFSNASGRDAGNDKAAPQLDKF